MDEQRLWAPWRMNYIAGDKSAEAADQTPIAWLPGAEQACFICKAAAAYNDEAAARLARERTLAFLHAHVG